MNIYVGNIPRQASEDDLRPLFEPFGKIMSVNIIKDKFSGEAKGFGFVEMDNDADAEKAIESLDNSDLQGRKLRVNQAKPRTDNPPRRESRY